MTSWILGDAYVTKKLLRTPFIDVFIRTGTLYDPGSFTRRVRRIAVNRYCMLLRSPCHSRRVAERAEPENFESGWDGSFDVFRALQRVRLMHV